MRNDVVIQIHISSEDNDYDIQEYGTKIRDSGFQLPNQHGNQYLYPYAIHEITLREVQKLPRTI